MASAKTWCAGFVLVVAAAALPAAGCSDDNEADGTGGSSGSTGSGGSSASGGSGAVDSGTGGAPPVVPAPTQDPTSGKWMCTDPATRTQHVCQCNDGIDNDGDQAIDNLDPNCAAGPYTDSESSTTGNCGTTQCSNCIDDDNDGLIDSADVECTGALDNSEASFATGISGDNSDACKQDCFFDGNSGSGDDGCLWNLKCDPENPGATAEKPCPYDENFNNCAPQTEACIEYCGQYTPNGCDCFGCCTVSVDGQDYDVKLVPTCSADNITDANACPPCTKETTCNNPCEPCEYCLGKAPDPTCETPDAGVDAPPPGQCPVGRQACTPGDAAGCPAGYYCLTGCCVPEVT
jgi:hypothetical protein